MLPRCFIASSSSARVRLVCTGASPPSSWRGGIRTTCVYAECACLRERARVRDALVPPVLIFDNESRPVGVGDFKATKWQLSLSLLPSPVCLPTLPSPLLLSPPPPPSLLPPSLPAWCCRLGGLCNTVFVCCACLDFSDRVLHTCTFPVAVGFVVIF